MNINHEYVTRAHVNSRLGEAQQARRGHRLAHAIRTGRRAEQLAQQARLALARSL